MTFAIGLFYGLLAGILTIAHAMKRGWSFWRYMLVSCPPAMIATFLTCWALGLL